MASINTTGVSSVGEMFSLTCSITRAENITGDISLRWIGPDETQVVSTNSVQVGTPVTSGAVTTLSLQFTTLFTSHGGEYACQADLVSQDTRFTLSALQDVIVRGIFMMVSTLLLSHLYVRT